MHCTQRILITGASGLVGSALCEELNKCGYKNLTLISSRETCELTKFDQVKAFFIREKPEIVFHLAATVYGIGGNLHYGGNAFLENSLMNLHVIEASRLVGVKKIIAMGTVATYSEHCPSPIKEDMIWTGQPHDSESGYGHAKRAMLAQLLTYQKHYGLSFAYVISTNLFGPNDKYHEDFGHVIPSLIWKFYHAKKENSSVKIWGDGSAVRDFLYSKEMARALVLIMQKGEGPINVASGKQVKIQHLANLLADYFEIPSSRIIWDAKKPNGRMFSEFDLSRLKTLGFSVNSSFESSLYETADLFCLNFKNTRTRV